MTNHFFGAHALFTAPTIWTMCLIIVIIGCFKSQESYLTVDLMINALQSIWKLDRYSLHTPVRQCVPSSDSSFTLFFWSVSCLPQRFDARMPSVLSHYWIPGFSGVFKERRARHLPLAPLLGPPLEMLRA